MLQLWLLAANLQLAELLTRQQFVRPLSLLHLDAEECMIQIWTIATMLSLPLQLATRHHNSRPRAS